MRRRRQTRIFLVMSIDSIDNRCSKTSVNKNHLTPYCCFFLSVCSKVHIYLSNRRNCSDYVGFNWQSVQLYNLSSKTGESTMRSCSSFDCVVVRFSFEVHRQVYSYFSKRSSISFHFFGHLFSIRNSL